MKSSVVTLGFFKTYSRGIKETCNEKANKFEQIKVICLRANS